MLVAPCGWKAHHTAENEIIVGMEKMGQKKQSL